MSESDFDEPTRHERKVIEERAEQRGEETPESMTGEAPGEVGTTRYEAEVEAERRGTTADAVVEDVREDEEAPLDSGFQPRTG